MEKKNAVSKFPEFYYTRHMQAGLCGYENEIILVDSDAIAKLASTFNGKPVYIEHQDVNLDTMKQDAVGYVVDTWQEHDGWVWSKIMITDDEGHDVINKGYAVSNAYIPTEWGDGGTKHNLPYDRKVLNGEFTHLALVDNPRYEDAKIYTPEQYQARNNQLMNSLANSKPTEKKGFSMFYWKKEKVSDPTQADFVEYTNDKGETITKSIEEMKNALEAEAKAEEVKAKKVLVNGKEMTVAELTAAFEKLNAKKNDDKEEKENISEKDDEDEEKENEHDVVRDDFVNEDDEEKDETENKNGKDHFREMNNAHKKNSLPPIIVETSASKLARGNKYGSQK